MIQSEQDRVAGDEATGDGQLGDDAIDDVPLLEQMRCQRERAAGSVKVAEASRLDGETMPRDGVAASVPSVFSTGKDPSTGRFLPGNRLNQLAVRRDQATIDAIKAEFQPARVVSMLNMAWDAAESRNSPRAMKDITELILSYLIGKPTQYNVSTKMDGNMLLTLLRDARAPGIEDTGDTEDK